MLYYIILYLTLLCMLCVRIICISIRRARGGVMGCLCRLIFVRGGPPKESRKPLREASRKPLRVFAPQKGSRHAIRFVRMRISQAAWFHYISPVPAPTTFVWLLSLPYIIICIHIYIYTITLIIVCIHVYIYIYIHVYICTNNNNINNIWLLLLSSLFIIITTIKSPEIPAGAAVCARARVPAPTTRDRE